MSTATSARSARGSLPAEVTSFVGRRHEVTGVRRMLSTSRLVTLTGAGGVGKTRLAQRVGAEMRRAFPDGVWFVELAELRDPDLVAVTVAEALGIRESSVSPDAPGLADFLADQQVLLILDNCEQLIGACADLAETLLRSCPELRILATSRQALRLAGEATLAVQPLSVPDPDGPCNPAELARYESAGLLVERAVAVDPDFTVTDENCGAVARLCTALEGVPLAIELAVARLRVLSLSQIVDRLTDRFRLLTSGARNAPARQQTLRALIDWSWDLCSDAERRLWAHASVFSGGLELDAAERVCADDALPADTVLDLIASLVDKSVLTKAGDGDSARYKMLEVVREYGAAKLAEVGETDAVARRHCEFFADLVTWGGRHWASPEQPALMLRLHHEQGNLRVALEYAVTAGPAELALRMAADLEYHWFIRGFLSEGRHWLDRALGLPAPDDWPRVKALRVNALIALVQGDHERAAALLADARKLADRVPNPVEEAYISIVQANLKAFSGEPAAAVPLFAAALETFRETGAHSGEMWALSMLGMARGLAGRPADGYPDLISARDASAASGDVWWQAFALWSLSVLRFVDGDDDGAGAAAKESLEVRARLEDEQFAVVLSLESLAWVAGRQHRDQRAATLIGASTRMWRAMHTSLSASTSLNAFHEQTVSAVRARLGHRAYDTAMRQGVALSTLEAVAVALERPGTGSAAPAPAPRSSGGDFGLTRREREVAALIAEGLSNREIAARLVVAQRTAEGHVENILSKLGFSSRAQVAGWLAAQNPPPS